MVSSGWANKHQEQETEPKSPSIGVAEAVEKYLRHCQVKNNVAASTLTSYRVTLEHFLNFLKGRKDQSVATITAQTIRDFLATRAHCTPRTRRKELEHLRFLLWFCVDNDWIAKNPAAAKGSRGVRVKVPKGGATMALADEEIDTLLQAADEIDNSNKRWIARARLRAKALILTLAYTGLRIGDVISMLRRDVKRDGSIELEIVKTKQQLTLVLNPQVLAALNALPKESLYFFWSGPSESKLTTATGSARRTLAALGKKTGISVHPYRFRDSFAQKVLEATGDIRALQFALGHLSIRTTEVPTSIWASSTSSGYVTPSGRLRTFGQPKIPGGVCVLARQLIAVHELTSSFAAGCSC
jgi:site-specific recombinase XerD